MDIKSILTNPLLWATLGASAAGGYVKVKKEATWGKTAAWGAGGAVAGYTLASLYKSWDDAKKQQVQLAIAAAQKPKQQVAQSGFAEEAYEDDTVGFADDDAAAIFNQPQQLEAPVVVGPSSGYRGMGRDEAAAKMAAEQVEHDLETGYGSLSGMATESIDGLSDAEIMTNTLGNFDGAPVVDGDAELDPYDQLMVEYAEEKERPPGNGYN